MLTAGSWPILDHDDDLNDLVSTLTRPSAAERLPARAVLAVLGSVVHSHAESEQLPQVAVADFVTERFPVYLVERSGREVALVAAPIGAPAAVMVAEYLQQRGVRIAVGVGSCGTLRPFNRGEFFLPTRALRAEGTSHHYLPAGQWVDTDPRVRAACSSAIRSRGQSPVEVATWTTDGFYRETPAMVSRRLRQGCSVVEMECAAWAAWAQFRRVRFGQILFAADSLADGVYDPRDWGAGSHDVALRTALDAAFAVQD